MSLGWSSFFIFIVNWCYKTPTLYCLTTVKERKRRKGVMVVKVLVRPLVKSENSDSKFPTSRVFRVSYRWINFSVEYSGTKPP